MAAFNIEGHTLHSLLSLPTKGEYKDLEGERLHHMQQSLHGRNAPDDAAGLDPVVCITHGRIVTETGKLGGAWPLL